MGDDLFGFGCETNDHGRSLAGLLRDPRKYIGIFDEMERRRSVLAFLDLFGFDTVDSPIGDCGGAYESVGGQRGLNRGLHFACSFNANDRYARWSGTATGPVISVTFAPAPTAACAIAWPWRPDDRFPMNRTGSIGS